MTSSNRKPQKQSSNVKMMEVSKIMQILLNHMQHMLMEQYSMEDEFYQECFILCYKKTQSLNKKKLISIALI